MPLRLRIDRLARRGRRRVRAARSRSGHRPADTVHTDLAAARARLEAIAARERADPLVDPGDCTQWWLGDGVAPLCVVLVHGFTNGPRQYAELAPQLAARGHNVIVPRLPYHGYRDRMTTAPARLHAADLEAAGLEAATIALLCGTRVVVAGISVGATLAVWLATRVHVDAVAISPFFGLRPLFGPANGPLTTALARLPNRFLWWDPRRKSAQPPQHGYPRFSTHALAECLRMGRDAVPRARSPRTYPGNRITVVVNRREPVVNNAYAVRIARRATRLGMQVARREIVDAPPIHDIIEPTIPEARTATIYPELIAAIEAT